MWDDKLFIYNMFVNYELCVYSLWFFSFFFKRFGLFGGYVKFRFFFIIWFNIFKVYFWKYYNCIFLKENVYFIVRIL